MFADNKSESYPFLFENHVDPGQLDFQNLQDFFIQLANKYIAHSGN